MMPFRSRKWWKIPLRRGAWIPFLTTISYRWVSEVSTERVWFFRLRRIRRNSRAPCDFQRFGNLKNWRIWGWESWVICDSRGWRFSGTWWFKSRRICRFPACLWLDESAGCWLTPAFPAQWYTVTLIYLFRSCGVLIGPRFSCPVIYRDIDLLVQIMRGADWPPLFLPSDIRWHWSTCSDHAGCWLAPAFPAQRYTVTLIYLFRSCGVLIGPRFSCPVIYGDIDLLVQIMRGADWAPAFPAQWYTVTLIYLFRSCSKTAMGKKTRKTYSILFVDSLCIYIYTHFFDDSRWLRSRDNLSWGYWGFAFCTTFR